MTVALNNFCASTKVLESRKVRAAKNNHPRPYTKPPPPVFHCPPPSGGGSLWNAHPKVMIPLNHGGEARCPYCGTLYKFKGELPRAHH